MARYTLPQPLSMYRDTGLVEITKEFRNRYVQNMAADNALSKSILEMDSREQDQEAKQRLMDKYNTQLRQRSESGNYHLLGNAVVKDAQNFMMEYSPIRREKAAYDQWLKGLTDARDQFMKTGKGVDPFTYSAKIAEANYTYKGLEFNPDGSVVETSRAKLPSYVGYVDIDKRIQERMKDVVLSEIDTTGQEFMFDDRAEITQDPLTAAYYIKQGSYKKFLDEKLVSSVVNRVLNEADTKAYTTQTAYLENFTKDRINPESGQSLASDEIDARLVALNSEIAALEKKSPKDKKEKEEIQAQIEYRENLEEFILESREKGLDDLNVLVALSTQTKELNAIDAAITKYAGEKSVKYVRDYTESSRYNQMMKDGKGKSTIKFRVGADGLQTEVLGGVDVASKLELRNTAEATIREDKTKYGEDFVELASRGPVENQTMNEYYDELIDLSGGTLTKESVKTVRQRIQENNQIQELIDLQLEEAYTSEFKMSKQEFENFMEQKASNLSASYDDILEIDGQRFDINMGTIAEAFAQLGVEPSSNSDMIKTMNDDKQFRNKVVRFIAAQNFRDADFSQVDEQTLEVVRDDIRNDFIEETSDAIEAMVDRHMEEVEDSNEKVTKFLDPEQAISTDALIIPSFNDLTNNTTVQIQDLFSEGLPENFSLISIDDNGIKTTYNQLVEDDRGIFKDARDKPPTIVKDQMGLVAVSRPDGKPLILIPFKNKDGEIDNYYAEYDQIQAESINNYVNSMSFRLATMYRNGIHANLNEPWAPKVFEGSVIFNYNGSPEEKVIVNKISMSVEEGLKNIRLFLEENSQDL